MTYGNRLLLSFKNSKIDEKTAHVYLTSDNDSHQVVTQPTEYSSSELAGLAHKFLLSL